MVAFGGGDPSPRMSQENVRSLTRGVSFLAPQVHAIPWHKDMWIQLFGSVPHVLAVLRSVAMRGTMRWVMDTDMQQFCQVEERDCMLAVGRIDTDSAFKQRAPLLVQQEALPQLMALMICWGLAECPKT